MIRGVVVTFGTCEMEGGGGATCGGATVGGGGAKFFGGSCGVELPTMRRECKLGGGLERSGITNPGGRCALLGTETHIQQ